MFQALYTLNLTAVIVWSLISFTLISCDTAEPKEINARSDMSAGGEVNAGSDISAGDEVNAGDEPVAIDLERGEALYQQFCGFCHGAEGEGYLADNANALNNQDFLSVASDEFLTLSTVHGRPGTPMSPWGVEKGGPLDTSMVRDIVAFIRLWQTEPSLNYPAPSLTGAPQRGQPLYNAVCASCHGENGEGISAVSLNNPWFLETVDDGFLAHAIQVGRRGTSMGAYGPPLVNEQGLADLVSLIRSWASPVDMDPPPPFTPQVDQTPLHPEGEDPDFVLREDRFVPAQQVYDAL